MLYIDLLNIIGEFAGSQQDHPDGISEVRLRFTENFEVIYEERILLWQAMLSYYPQQDPAAYEIGFCTDYIDAISYSQWGYRIITYIQMLEEYDVWYMYNGDSWTNMYLY